MSKIIRQQYYGSSSQQRVKRYLLKVKLLETVENVSLTEPNRPFNSGKRPLNLNRSTAGFSRVISYRVLGEALWVTTHQLTHMLHTRAVRRSGH